MTSPAETVDSWKILLSRLTTSHSVNRTLLAGQSYTTTFSFIAVTLTSLPEGYYQNGVYVGRILKGAKAADLPIVQSTKFEFVINVKTAKSLGVTISDNLLSLVDEVIE